MIKYYYMFKVEMIVIISLYFSLNLKKKSLLKINYNLLVQGWLL